MSREYVLLLRIKWITEGTIGLGRKAGGDGRLGLFVGKFFVWHVLVEKLIDLVDIKIALDLPQLIYLNIHFIEFGRGFLRLVGRFRFVLFGHLFRSLRYYAHAFSTLW